MCVRETTFSLTLIQHTHMLANHSCFMKNCVDLSNTVVDDQFDAAIWLLWHSIATLLQLEHGGVHGCQV